MLEFNEIVLKLIDRFPDWYLMLIVSIIISYRIFRKVCKDNLLLIAKILGRWKIKNDKKDEELKNTLNEIYKKFDNLEDKVNKNTEYINFIINTKGK